MHRDHGADSPTSRRTIWEDHTDSTFLQQIVRVYVGECLTCMCMWVRSWMGKSSSIVCRLSVVHNCLLGLGRTCSTLFFSRSSCFRKSGETNRELPFHWMCSLHHFLTLVSSVWKPFSPSAMRQGVSRGNKYKRKTCWFFILKEADIWGPWAMYYNIY
jgi:hypothetical protein